jgi:hypothetical protein
MKRVEIKIPAGRAGICRRRIIEGTFLSAALVGFEPTSKVLQDLLALTPWL